MPESVTFNDPARLRNSVDQNAEDISFVKEFIQGLASFEDQDPEVRKVLSECVTRLNRVSHRLRTSGS